MYYTNSSKNVGKAKIKTRLFPYSINTIGNPMCAYRKEFFVDFFTCFINCWVGLETGFIFRFFFLIRWLLIIILYLLYFIFMSFTDHISNLLISFSITKFSSLKSNKSICMFNSKFLKIKNTLKRFT